MIYSFNYKGKRKKTDERESNKILDEGPTAAYRDD